MQAKLITHDHTDQNQDLFGTNSQLQELHRPKFFLILGLCTTRGKHENNNSNKLSSGETICPRRSRRIYVRARMDLQSAQLRWPGHGTVRLGAARWDRQTDGRLMLPYGRGHNNKLLQYMVLWDPSSPIMHIPNGTRSGYPS